MALVVGLLMFPVCDLGIRPGRAALLILALYPICGIVASLPRPGLLAGMLIDFIFVWLLMALFTEPAMLKPHINFLLCFLFCRSMPCLLYTSSDGGYADERDCAGDCTLFPIDFLSDGVQRRDTVSICYLT